MSNFEKITERNLTQPGFIKEVWYKLEKDTDGNLYFPLGIYIRDDEKFSTGLDPMEFADSLYTKVENHGARIGGSSRKSRKIHRKTNRRR
jgi:hypothetical protein